MRAHHHHHRKFRQSGDEFPAGPEGRGRTHSPDEPTVSLGGRSDGERRRERGPRSHDEGRRERRGEHRGPGPHTRGGHRGHDRRRGPGRAGRGDVRTAILRLLAEEPMHGYQLMQLIAERTNGTWTPSPGAIYPALNLLEDEGLVLVTAEGGRKLASLTDQGQTLVAEQGARWVDPFQTTAGGDDSHEAARALRDSLGEIREATRHLARTGDAAKVKAAADLLAKTRRELYLLLAGDEA